ncbi:four helix bundle protein [candidate division WOR-3 bacterium]|nr:four helix bundle protein [candidate division WOR-3 bacterium]
MSNNRTKTHKDLEIWNKGIDLVMEIYKSTKNFPDEEKYGLVSQMRRASISYPSNISEGAARNSNAEYIRYVYIALGSLSELETQTIISEKLGYINNTENILENIGILRKQSHKFIKYLKSLSNV